MADIETYVVQAGDTLYSLAKKWGTTVAELVSFNNIKDANYIVVGQTLKTSGTASETPSSTTSRVTIDVFGLQSNTTSTIYASWTWTKENTANYQVMWYYSTGDAKSDGSTVWFVGNDGTATHYDDLKGGQSTYSAPSNAKQVKFKVKPVSETRDVKGVETAYWTGSWSTEKTYDFTSNPPLTPPVPSVSIEKYLLECEIDNINLNATSVQFQVVKDNTTVFKTSNTTIKTDFNYARYTCYVDAGSEYKVRCRSCRDNIYSEWSEYSSSVSTIPSAPSGITVCRAKSETSVYLEWAEVANAETYDLEYTTKLEYFDGSDQTTTQSGIEYAHFEKTGLQSGEQYFFRVRAVNDRGTSSWSEAKSITLGKKPAAPTTWSSTTTAITGDALTLYWMHNSEDESSQTVAELEMYVDGVLETHEIQNDRPEEDKDKTSTYVIDTKEYVEGTKIQWRVRTAGITGEYGDWSIQRTVDIYAPATLELGVKDVNGSTLETLTTFPFYISGKVGPNTQSPVGYHLTITSNDVYETVDAVGNPKIVNKGERVYSQYFDTSDQLSVTMSANNIDLENNVHYTITCIVSMNSGLTAESSKGFLVAWTDEMCEPNCEIGVDMETYTASIRPYCQDVVGNLIEGLTLAVYRREFDGSFTELISGVDNLSNTFITDPHPALDFARYRIVATSKTTGAVSYYDSPGYPVGGNAVIIQWEEAWSSFDTSSEDDLEEPVWSGSMLKIPYNIDVSDSNTLDVSHVRYIGRAHPIAYYGTQLGIVSTWNVEIPKTDKETIYALRRLSKWMGDVYVREPSGSGYWANISVSFSQKHLSVTVPVTINITRVEGGA